MDRPDFQFRQAQAAFDLIWLLQAQDDVLLAQIGGQEFPRIVRERSCRFEDEVDAKCYERLAVIALDSSEGADIAVAMIVANDLQRGLWSGDTKDFAEMAEEKIRASRRHLRTAILRGLDILEDISYSYEPAEYFLPNETRLTRPAEQILPKLCEVAKTMDEPTRESVAAADYGSDIDQHLEALNDALSSETCLFPKDVWYPSEVVELVSHVRSTPGFVPCTALLLANALQGRDNVGWFKFRWTNLAADYNNLPKSARAPILAGLRILYESGEDFMPYSGAKHCDPVTKPEGMIDFVKLPDGSF
ncbi:hypothetical protein [Ruegeria halocynthiae]|uniref:hypothetical protein n=1 Tax=Ruegeria halocynthiae TaxID=985054 RepID=UPI0005622E75|nr:hypothetical protein [Ruegeria halocynthiae]